MSTGDREEIYTGTQSSGPAELHEAEARPCPIEEDAPSPMQIEIYRRMTPERRLEIAEQLYWSARRLKAAWIRSLHPAWSEEQVEIEVKRIFTNARS